MNTHELIVLKNQFEQIAKAKGKAKLPLIKIFGNNPNEYERELFVETYNFVFNPHISSGLAKKKMQKELGAQPYKNENNTLLAMFGYLKEHSGGSDQVIKSVQSWILGQPEETHEFLTNVFIQDLTIGASEKALNEALGYEYIPVHEIMLAKRWEKEEHKIRDGEEFFVTLKMDDYRCTVMWNDKEQKWELKARSGLLFEGIVEIEEIFSKLPKHIVYDGGLLSTDTLLKSKDRFRKTSKILRTDGPKSGIMFYIYDIVTKDEFENSKGKYEYDFRQDEISAIFDAYDLNKNPLFERVPRLYKGSDKEQIMPLLEKVLAEEYEGLMVNTAKGKYEAKRTDQLLKVKEFYSVDLRITGYKEYKHPNMLGAFKVDYKGNDCWVGGGFKLHERKEFWEKRDEMIGTIIEVRYFQESNNQNGGKSIRHGHFMNVRWDKNEPSYD